MLHFRLRRDARFYLDSALLPSRRGCGVRQAYISIGLALNGPYSRHALPALGLQLRHILAGRIESVQLPVRSVDARRRDFSLDIRQPEPSIGKRRINGCQFQFCITLTGERPRQNLTPRLDSGGLRLIRRSQNLCIKLCLANPVFLRRARPRQILLGANGDTGKIRLDDVRLFIHTALNLNAPLFAYGLNRAGRQRLICSPLRPDGIKNGEALYTLTLQLRHRLPGSVEFVQLPVCDINAGRHNSVVDPRQTLPLSRQLLINGSNFYLGGALLPERRDLHAGARPDTRRHQIIRPAQRSGVLLRLQLGIGLLFLQPAQAFAGLTLRRENVGLLDFRGTLQALRNLGLALSAHRAENGLSVNPKPLNGVRFGLDNPQLILERLKLAFFLRQLPVGLCARFGTNRRFISQFSRPANPYLRFRKRLVCLYSPVEDLNDTPVDLFLRRRDTKRGSALNLRLPDKAQFKFGLPLLLRRLRVQFLLELPDRLRGRENGYRQPLELRLRYRRRRVAGRWGARRLPELIRRLRQTAILLPQRRQFAFKLLDFLPREAAIPIARRTLEQRRLGDRPRLGQLPLDAADLLGDGP